MQSSFFSIRFVYITLKLNIMNTTDNKYSTTKENKDPRNQNQNKDDRSTLMNEELYDIDDMKESDDNTREIAERGYTIRNGYNPNKPNPDQIADEEDLDDDFHTEKDLKHDSDDLYLEKLDLNGNNIADKVNDEFDNPSDVLEDDFNETEDDLEDLDQDDEEEEEYIEDDVQEDEDAEKIDVRE